MDTETTNLVDGEDTSADTLDTGTEVETEGEELEPELDEDGNPIDPEPDDSEEVEHEGQKYKVPKALKPLLLMQADYTRKTQDLAEQRRVFETERQQVGQATHDELNAFAQATSIQQQLAAFQRVDWNAWNDQYPFEAQKAFMQFQQLKDAHQGALGQLQFARQQRLSMAQQETARRIEQGRQQLATEISGWNDDLKAKLIGFAAEYGFSRDELDDLESDPRVAKVLHAAFQGRDATRKTQQAQRHLAAQQAQPAATVKAHKAPPTGLDDRLSAGEWLKRRNAQLQKRG
jgi:hypothetical protein